MPRSSSNYKFFFFALSIILGFAIIELIGGWFAHSLALLGDAGHMGSDALALGIAGFASWMTQKPASSKHSYGYGRAEIIAACLSSLMMIVITIWIVVEAIERLKNPAPVQGGWVMAIAFLGLCANILAGWLLSRGQRTLNAKAALLHIMSDVLGSLAALVAGAVIYLSGWSPIDPILSLFISVLILISSVNLLRETIAVLMESVPKNIDVSQVATKLSTIEHVHAIHDIHTWSLSSGLVLLTAHVNIDHMNHWNICFQKMTQILRDDFHIEHVTLQPEVASETTLCQTDSLLCAHKLANDQDDHHGHHH